MADTQVRVRFATTASYNGRVYSVGEEVSMSEEVAGIAVARNIVTFVEPVDMQEPKFTEEDFKRMTVVQLEEYADNAGISLAGVTRKADIISVILGAI